MNEIKITSITPCTDCAKQTNKKEKTPYILIAKNENCPLIVPYFLKFVG